MRARIASFVAAVAWLATTHAHAQSAAPASPEESLRRGVELRTHGDNDGAYREFLHAYQLAPTPVAAGQLGLAEQAIGNWIEAERHLEEAMRASNDPWIERNRAALERAEGVIRDHLGTLVVRVSEPGADVLIDGVSQGTTPLAAPLRLRAGDATLEVRRAGYYPVSRRVTVGAGAVALEAVELHPLPSSAPEPSAAPSPPPPASSSPPPTASAAPVPREPSRAPISPPVWIGASVLSVSLTALVVAAVIRESAIAQFNADPSCLPPEYPQVTANCQSLVAVNTPGLAVEIAGGALAAISAIATTLFFVRDHRSATDSHARGSLHCAPAGATAVSCEIAF